MIGIVDPRKSYYILNPSGELGRTEEHFKSCPKYMEFVSRQGISGHAPNFNSRMRYRICNDLVVSVSVFFFGDECDIHECFYRHFGHGGDEQYVRSHKIRYLTKRAAAMLRGCFSGFLREMGNFDRVRRDEDQ